MEKENEQKTIHRVHHPSRTGKRKAGDVGEGRERMKKELKAAWLADLRSGEITQTTGTLKDQNGMCCLGVLAACAVRLGMTGIVQVFDDKMYVGGAYGELGPNHSEANTFGLQPDTAMTLARKNDSGWSFSLIADWIEKNVEEEI